MPRKTSGSRTEPATPAAASAEPSNSSSSAESISVVAPRGDRRLTLVAARNRIAGELDDTKWNNHKSYCRCDCGLTNPQAVVALVKELRATEAELASLPAAPEEASDLDRLADELASRRATRRTATSGL